MFLYVGLNVRLYYDIINKILLFSKKKRNLYFFPVHTLGFHFFIKKKDY